MFVVQSETQSSKGPAPPLLTWQVTQKKMPWNIVLLLGGGFALAKGSEVRACKHASVCVCVCGWPCLRLCSTHGPSRTLSFSQQASGLSRWLGDQMTPLHSVPPWAIAIILCLLIATFTECASNVATATLFLPILASLVFLDTRVPGLLAWFTFCC